MPPEGSESSTMQPKTPPKRASCFGGEEDEDEEEEEIEDYNFTIGWPSDVQHIAHVTFDRFKGFLGLPQDLEQHVPGRAPSASQSVFGVGPESMQCSYDDHGNSVPTILLLLQARLYNQGGLQAEGIFRVAAGNDHEEHVRGQLNNGIVPTNIDVHALAGLIKAWFRELPDGVLDSFTHDQVKELADADDESGAMKLASSLPPARKSLLDWTVNLMTDVVEYEQQNKMNAHNIATVFAPNMFQVLDPITALVHAAKVMKVLKLLVARKQRERQETATALDVASAKGGGSDSEDEHVGGSADNGSTEEGISPRDSGNLISPMIHRGGPPTPTPSMALGRRLDALTEQLPEGFKYEGDGADDVEGNATPLGARGDLKFSFVSDSLEVAASPGESEEAISGSAQQRSPSSEKDPSVSTALALTPPVLPGDVVHEPQSRDGCLEDAASPLPVPVLHQPPRPLPPMQDLGDLEASGREDSSDFESVASDLGDAEAYAEEVTSSRHSSEVGSVEDKVPLIGEDLPREQLAGAQGLQAGDEPTAINSIGAHEIGVTEASEEEGPQDVVQPAGGSGRNGWGGTGQDRENRGQPGVVPPTDQTCFAEGQSRSSDAVTGSLEAGESFEKMSGIGSGKGNSGATAHPTGDEDAERQQSDGEHVPGDSDKFDQGDDCKNSESGLVSSGDGGKETEGSRWLLSLDDIAGEDFLPRGDEPQNCGKAGIHIREPAESPQEEGEVEAAPDRGSLGQDVEQKPLLQSLWEQVFSGGLNTAVPNETKATKGHSGSESPEPELSSSGSSGPQVSDPSGDKVIRSQVNGKVLHTNGMEYGAVDASLEVKEGGMQHAEVEEAGSKGDCEAELKVSAKPLITSKSDNMDHLWED